MLLILQLEGMYVIELSEKQRWVVSKISEMLKDGQRIIKVGGLAGTGKTTLAVQLPELLGIERKEVCFIAPTNKATLVLSEKHKAQNISQRITTVHKKFYRPISRHCPTCPYTQSERKLCHGNNTYNACGCVLTFNPREIGGIKLFICDESSMIGRILYDDIIDTMPPDSAIVFFGDHFQLPPVESGSELIRLGYSYNDKLDLMDDAPIKMDSVDDIHRQAKDSPIIQLAHKVRNGQTLGYGDFSPEVRRLPYPDDGEFDINLDNTDLMMLTFFSKNNYYVNSKPARNFTFHSLNKSVRSLRGLTGPPKPGEKVVCNRNIKHHGIPKGARGVIDWLEVIDSESYLATITTEYGKTLTRVQISAKQFEGMMPDGADHLQRWSYAYAQTTHTAQGSEYDEVVIFEPDEGFQRKLSSGQQYDRWLYTGVTRAKKRLTIFG
jgi:exodeoxyribonuclease-5